MSNDDVGPHAYVFDANTSPLPSQRLQEVTQHYLDIIAAEGFDINDLGQREGRSMGTFNFSMEPAYCWELVHLTERLFRAGAEIAFPTADLLTTVPQGPETSTNIEISTDNEAAPVTILTDFTEEQLDEPGSKPLITLRVKVWKSTQ